MTKRERMAEELEGAGFADGEGPLFADGLDDAILGVSRRFGQATPLVAYDYGRVISTPMERDGMGREEAEEFFEFNIIGSWVGDGTPLFVSLAEL